MNNIKRYLTSNVLQSVASHQCSLLRAKIQKFEQISQLLN